MQVALQTAEMTSARIWCACESLIKLGLEAMATNLGVAISGLC